MQIVIDISDEDYKRIKDTPDAFNSLTSRAYKSIKNGTPLPKGHKRLIEDNFKAGFILDKEGYLLGYQYVTQEELNDAQTIIEADTESEDME